MKKILMLAATFAALTFTSCKKDKGDEPAPGQPATELLKKVTVTEGDDVTVYNYSYNAAKKLVSVISTDNSEKTLFTYDAAGNVTRVEETNEDSKNIYTFTYANGKPVSGTFKSWLHTAGEPDELVEDDELTYTLTNDQVTGIALKMKMMEMEVNFELQYTNGNLTKVKSVGSEWYQAVFTFGNKKPIFPTVSKYILDHAGFSLQFAAKNEILSAKYDFPGTELDDEFSNQYTYNDKGYVLTGKSGSTQMVFEY